MKSDLFLPEIKTELKDDVYYVKHNDPELDLFLNQYYAFSKKEREQIKYDYTNAPFEFPEEQKFEWLWRQETLKIVEKQIRVLLASSPLSCGEGAGERLNILEVSPWNYWLTQHISKNNNVVCCDYFDDEYEGLRSRKHFQNPNWTSICCDLENLNIFERKFDLIIINHSLQFFKDHKKLVTSLKNTLSDKGQILLVGLNVYKNSESKKVVTQDLQSHYKKTGFDSSVRMGKGYLAFIDIDFLEINDFVKYSYKGWRFALRNCRALLRKNTPFYCYMLFE